MIFQEGKNVHHSMAHSASCSRGQAQLADVGVERRRQCQDEQDREDDPETFDKHSRER